MIKKGIIFVSVKITKIIVLLFLVVKTSVGMDLAGLFATNCCSDKIELCDTEGAPLDDEDSGCCDGPDCECMCCGHVFLDFGSSQSIKLLPTEIHVAEFKYISSTSLQDPTAVWHPPRIF